MAADWNDLPTDALLQRGIAAARVGENDEARAMLAEVTARAPENADAWLWRAGVETQPRLKREYFEKVLRLRPDDVEARAGLDRLTEKYGSGVLASDSEIEMLHCTWHPDRETLLRCNRCDRPMCTECAVQHPVGLRCKECIKETRSPLYKVSAAGYALATGAGLVVGFLGAVVLLLVGSFPWLGWILAFFWGGAVGAGQAEAVGRAAGRKRGPGLQLVGAATLVIGLGLVLLFRAGSPNKLLPYVQAYLFTSLIYLFASIGAVWARLR
jgi:hypothetical protein